MTLEEIKPVHGEGLYDRDGNLVGRWNGERGMFRDCFVVRERVCHVVGTFSLKWLDSTKETYVHDLSCGHICRTNWPEPPCYCDQCGARVVDDDD